MDTSTSKVKTVSSRREYIQLQMVLTDLQKLVAKLFESTQRLKVWELASRKKEVKTTQLLMEEHSNCLKSLASFILVAAFYYDVNCRKTLPGIQKTCSLIHCLLYDTLEVVSFLPKCWLGEACILNEPQMCIALQSLLTHCGKYSTTAFGLDIPRIYKFNVTSCAMNAVFSSMITCFKQTPTYPEYVYEYDTLSAGFANSLCHFACDKFGSELLDTRRLEDASSPVSILMNLFWLLRSPATANPVNVSFCPALLGPAVVQAAKYLVLACCNVQSKELYARRQPHTMLSNSCVHLSRALAWFNDDGLIMNIRNSSPTSLVHLKPTSASCDGTLMQILRKVTFECPQTLHQHTSLLHDIVNSMYKTNIEISIAESHMIGIVSYCSLHMLIYFQQQQQLSGHPRHDCAVHLRRLLLVSSDFWPQGEVLVLKLGSLENT